MDIRAGFGSTLVGVAALALMFPADALAYLDPGTGSMFVQTVIALLAAAGYALRVYWRRLQRLVRRSDEPAPTPPAVEHGRPPRA